MSKNNQVDIIDIYEVERKHNGHWFDAGSKRFFSSRVATYAYRGAGGVFFVSSEQDKYNNGVRRYSVRQQKESGDIRTVGDFQQYNSRDAAHRAARGYASGELALPEKG